MTPKDRTLAAFAFLVASFVWAATPLATSHATPPGPTATGGSIPWISATGANTPFTSQTAYTVPANRVFVLTTLCGGDYAWYLNLYEGGSVRVPGLGYKFHQATGATNSQHISGLFCRGTGQVSFQAGADVVVNYFPQNAGDPTVEWYMEGYLAQP